MMRISVLDELGVYAVLSKNIRILELLRRGIGLEIAEILWLTKMS